MKHHTEKTQIRASFPHTAKIQEVIILPMKTHGVQENKTGCIK